MAYAHRYVVRGVNIGQTKQFNLTIRDKSHALITPTALTVDYTDPSGNSAQHVLGTSGDFTTVSTGKYQYRFTNDEGHATSPWLFKITAEGTDGDGIIWIEMYVDPNP